MSTDMAFSLLRGIYSVLYRKDVIFMMTVLSFIVFASIWILSGYFIIRSIINEIEIRKNTKAMLERYKIREDLTKKGL